MLYHYKESYSTKFDINKCLIELVETLLFNIDIDIFFKMILLLENECNAD